MSRHDNTGSNFCRIHLELHHLLKKSRCGNFEGVIKFFCFFLRWSKFFVSRNWRYINIFSNHGVQRIQCRELFVANDVSKEQKEARRWDEK